MTPHEFIERLKPYASIISNAGLYPSVWIAQACLETGFGRVSALGNNLWGIKHHYGRAISKQTREVIDGKNWHGAALFQFYETIEEAARDYVWLLTLYPKFRDAFLTTLPHDQFIDVLGPLYATDAPEEVDGDPSYAEKIKSIIARFDLESLDKKENTSFNEVDE